MSSNDGIHTRKWRRIRLAILARDERTCAWCGGEANTVDHLLARAEGGTNEPGNLVACCVTCNSRRGAQVATRRRGRGSRSVFKPPATTPTSSSPYISPGLGPDLGGKLWKAAHAQSGSDGQ
jgi:5-methylcytosine-specific restriction endonuclease McrA